MGRAGHSVAGGPLVDSVSMKIFGIAGWKNSGKTTLIVALVEILSARGFRVSTVKHAHHDFDIDHKGKDSWRHRQAGATDVIVASGRRWAMIHEHRDEEEAGLDALLNKLGPCDLVLVEGFKTGGHQKIQVYGGREGETLMAPHDPTVAAIVTDQEVSGKVGNLPVLTLKAPEQVADFILERKGLS